MDACSDLFQDTCINCSTFEFLLNTTVNGLSNRSETPNDSKEREFVINVLSIVMKYKINFTCTYSESNRQSGVLHMYQAPVMRIWKNE